MTASGIADYYSAERPEFISFISQSGPFALSIDIGCAGGKLGSELIRSGIVNECDGIEPFSAAAMLAKDSLRRVWQGSVEMVSSQVPWHEYDLLIMADVLEHLADPWSVLRLLYECTAPDCCLALSIPNIRHYKVVLPLLFKGEFRYRDHGIMDRTHLHFYTRSSIAETLRECGWKIQRIGSHIKKRYRRRYFPTRLLEPFLAVQYLLIAEKQ